jgi:hypothetical protein
MLCTTARNRSLDKKRQVRLAHTKCLPSLRTDTTPLSWATFGGHAVSPLERLPIAQVAGNHRLKRTAEQEQEAAKGLKEALGNGVGVDTRTHRYTDRAARRTKNSERAGRSRGN